VIVKFSARPAHPSPTRPRVGLFSTDLLSEQSTTPTTVEEEPVFMSHTRILRPPSSRMLSGKDLSQVRGLGIAAITRTWAGLPSGERALEDPSQSNHPTPSSAKKSARTATAESMKWTLCQEGTAPASATDNSSSGPTIKS